MRTITSFPGPLFSHYRRSPVSNTISIGNNKERPQNRNLAGATVNAPGAELAQSSNSDKTIWCFIAFMVMIFFGALRFSPTFRETVLESAILVAAFIIGLLILVSGVLFSEWFKNTPRNDYFALGTRALAVILLVAVCYMFPMIMGACAILAASSWTMMNTKGRYF